MGQFADDIIEEGIQRQVDEDYFTDVFDDGDDIRSIIEDMEDMQ